MSMKNWAEREIEIACKRENPDWDGKSFDYGCSCYQSALKAYKSLCEDGHSGYSFSITKNILIRLMEGLPLTPIENTEDVWEEVKNFNEDDSKTYQCKRKHSLFKDVSPDGTIKFHDVDRAVAFDLNDENNFGYQGAICNIVDELFPIEFPYNPPKGRYEIYVDNFIAEGFEGDDEDYNTSFIPYIITPKGKKVEINKCYADKNHRLVLLDEEESKARLAKRRK